VLSPTRELAEQTQKVCLALGDYLNISGTFLDKNKNTFWAFLMDLLFLVHCCIGGKSMDDDINRLEKGVQIISGTPGRIYDMI